MANNNIYRGEKKIVLLVIYVAVIILGVYMTFFHVDEEKMGMDIQETISSQEDVTMYYRGTDYSSRELPNILNNTADETYTEDSIHKNDIYFSNTEKLDTGKLPFEVQAVLVEKVETYLKYNGYNDVRELYISNESYEESEEKVAFLCFLDGYKEELQIEYSFTNNCLNFSILSEGTDKGVEHEE